VFPTKSRIANGYIAGVRVDITALKAAEQALSKSEEQLKRAQRLAHMGSDLRNLSTDEAEWSDETYRIFGVSRETYVPSIENFLRMLHPDDRPTVFATREQTGRVSARNHSSIVSFGPVARCDRSISRTS
jgi:PAS domain-containing protein